MEFGDRQIQGHERQTGGTTGVGTQRVWDIGSQPGSDPREYIGKITGKRVEGRLGAGKATKGRGPRAGL